MKIKIMLTLLFLLSVFVVNTLYHAGVFAPINAHSEFSDITIYNNVAGPEDLAIDRTNGLLFISSSDRWRSNSNNNSDKSHHSADGIYLLKIGSDQPPVKLETTYTGDFHPHGISFLHTEGADYLFVINHNRQGDFVELFKVENNRLVHLESFESEQMCCPNDLVAVDVDKFYVTNDHAAPEGIARVLEDYLRIAKSSVLYFDGSDFSTVYANLNYANGINISHDGQTLYVTETTGRKISVLDRDVASGALTLRFTKKLYTGLDNITLDADGNLWIAAHPKLLAFVEHAKNPQALSPSQVLKLTPIGEDDFQVTEVYLDSGAEISGSSTALYYQGKVYVGLVFERKILVGSYFLRDAGETAKYFP